MAYRVTLENIFGIHAARVVHDREQIRSAMLTIITSVPYLSPGDRLQVVEVDALTGKPVRQQK